MTHEEMEAADTLAVDHIADQLRATVREFGQEALVDAVLIGPPFLLPRETVCGHAFVACRTLGSYTLGNVDWKVARTFEEF